MLGKDQNEDKIDERVAIILDTENNTYKMVENLFPGELTLKDRGREYSLDPAKGYIKKEKNWKKLGLSSDTIRYWLFKTESPEDGEKIKPLTHMEMSDNVDYGKMSPFEMKQIVESDLERNLEHGLKTPTEKITGKKMYILFALVAVAVIIVYYSGVI